MGRSLAWFGLLGAVSASEEPATIDEQVLVARAHCPVLVENLSRDPAAEGRCSALDAHDVEVLQGGEPRPVTAIGPRPLPRLHALLIDTSNSMVSRIDEAKRAARSFVDGLPADERVLVAAFDENLELLLPPTADRDRARSSIDRLRIGYFTALWDALHYLIVFLESEPGEKVVVLLTDGEDSSSRKAHRFEKVLELAAATPNLVVFPIGIQLPGRIRLRGTDGIPTARGKLGQLARRTGGEFFDIRDVRQLDRTLERIRERLDNRLYVSYVPREAESDRGGRIRVRARGDLPCRVVPLGSPGRHELRRLGPSNALDRRPAGRSPSPETIACVRGAAPISSEELRLSEESGAGAQSLILALDDPRLLAGRVFDLVVENGPLFDAKRYLAHGKLRRVSRREPVHELRDIVILTPPLDTLLTRLDGPEALLAYLLEQDLCAPEARDGRWRRSPFLIHGQSFLELRELFGRALLSERDDYRKWAVERVRSQALREIELLLAATGRSQLSEEQRTGLEQAILRRSTDPSRGRPHVYLSGWLGDVSAREVAIALELGLCRRFLEASDEATRARVASFVDSWPKLARWFPPAIAGRVLTPLVPVRDPERDLIGFYRILLPRPEQLEGRPQLLPPRPLGLMAVRTILDGATDVPFSVVDLEYGSRRVKGCGPRASLERVVIGLSSGDGRSERPALRLELFFPADASRPSCYHVDRVALPTGLERLAEDLEDRLSRSAARVP